MHSLIELDCEFKKTTYIYQQDFSHFKTLEILLIISDNKLLKLWVLYDQKTRSYLGYSLFLIRLTLLILPSTLYRVGRVMVKRVQIYFSPKAWTNLQGLMGKEGKPSQIINSIFEPLNNITIGHKLVQKSPKNITLSIDAVSAGFPSPAQSYADRQVDINDILITNELATFIVTVNSRSMLEAGIDINDQLIVDKSITPNHGDIVIALIDNDFTVKRLMLKPSVYLKAENPEFKDIHFQDEQQLVIWGVVTYIIKNARSR